MQEVTYSAKTVMIPRLIVPNMKNILYPSFVWSVGVTFDITKSMTTSGAGAGVGMRMAH